MVPAGTGDPDPPAGEQLKMVSINRKQMWHTGMVALLFAGLLVTCISCLGYSNRQENDSAEAFISGSCSGFDEEHREESSDTIFIPEEISHVENSSEAAIISAAESNGFEEISFSEVSGQESAGESTGHVHNYVAEQRILTDAYDETVTVTDKEAWDEAVTIIDQDAWDETVTVIDSDAWDETVVIVDQDAWDETVTVIDEEAYDYISEEIDGYRCRCGAFFTAADDGKDGSIAVNVHQRAMTEQIDAKYQAIIDAGQWEDRMLAEWDLEVAEHGSYADSCEFVWTHVDAVSHEETVHHDAVTHEETIHHEAAAHEETVHHEPVVHTEMIHHPAETHTETIHYEAVYETIYVCRECGAVKE